MKQRYHSSDECKFDIIVLVVFGLYQFQRFFFFLEET